VAVGVPSGERRAFSKLVAVPAPRSVLKAKSCVTLARSPTVTRPHEIGGRSALGPSGSGRAVRK
jgi:hypothetical protein